MTLNFPVRRSFSLSDRSIQLRFLHELQKHRLRPLHLTAIAVQLSMAAPPRTDSDHTHHLLTDFAMSVTDRPPVTSKPLRSLTLARSLHQAPTLVVIAPSPARCKPVSPAVRRIPPFPTGTVRAASSFPPATRSPVVLSQPFRPENTPFAPCHDDEHHEQRPTSGAESRSKLTHPGSFNVPHMYRRSYSRFLSPMASRTWIAQCSRSSPCHTFFVPGSCCREEGCDPTSRPRSMTTALMSGAFPSGILTTFR